MFASKKYIFMAILLLSCFFLSKIKSEVPVSEYLKMPEIEESRKFISTFVSANDVVFDVGAHVGKKTDLYLSLGARVVCIEPQPECLAELTKKFCDNHSVHIEPVGLADKEGNLEFLQCDQATTISTFSPEYTQRGRFAENNYTWGKKMIIPVTTLDKMIEKYGIPHFCKIDVENFEYEVIKGLSVPIHYLSFESNTEWIENTKKCIFLLEELGYKKFNFAIAERGWFMFNDWLPADIFCQKLSEAALESKWKEIGGLWGDVYACYGQN